MMDREKALQIIWDRCQHSKETEKALEVLKEERPHGEWIYHAEWELNGECAYECSRCGMGADVDYNFCPNCGSDNRLREEAKQ